MTWARMRDKNEREIVEALVVAGASVTRLNATGVPDLLVGYQGTTYLLEVKRPLGPRGGITSSTTAKKRGESGEMTEAQERWWARWKGQSPVVVRTAGDALNVVGAASTAMETSLVPVTRSTTGAAPRTGRRRFLPA